MTVGFARTSSGPSGAEKASLNKALISDLGQTRDGEQKIGCVRSNPASRLEVGSPKFLVLKCVSQ